MTNPRTTCRQCARMSLDLTCCDLYGPMLPDELDDAALGRMCARLGQFVRRLHAEPRGIRLSRGSGSVKEAADEDGVGGDRAMRVLRGLSVEEWGALSPNAKPRNGRRPQDEEDRHEHAGPQDPREATERGRIRACRREADKLRPDEALVTDPPRDNR